MAETKKEANAAFNLFVETYGVKYERAVAKLVKDRDVLLTFYDSPAEHWKHIRTTNPPSQACKHALSGNNRKRLCHGPQPHTQNQRVPEPKDRPRHGLQADDVRQEKVAENLRAKPSARSDPGDCFQGWDQATSNCRLITPSPTFGHNSAVLGCGPDKPPLLETLHEKACSLHVPPVARQCMFTCMRGK